MNREDFFNTEVEARAAAKQPRKALRLYKHELWVVLNDASYRYECWGTRLGLKAPMNWEGAI